MLKFTIRESFGIFTLYNQYLDAEFHEKQKCCIVRFKRFMIKDLTS